MKLTLTRLNNKAIIIGHRGYFTEGENSIPAFKKAVETKIPAVELDIWLTKDNIPVVIHTHSDTSCISETSSGFGQVKDFTLDEIKFFNLKNSLEKIPTLEEVLIICQNNLIVDIEIKEKEKKEEIIDISLSLVKKYNMENNVLFSSFEHSYYELLRSRSDIEFKFLADEQKDIDKLASYNYTNYSIGCNSLLGTKENIDIFHNKNVEVSVYFYPDSSISDKKLGELLNNGVDHFFVDTPLEGAAILNKYYEKI